MIFCELYLAISIRHHVIVLNYSHLPKSMLVIIAQESGMGPLHNPFSQYTSYQCLSGCSMGGPHHWMREIWVEIEIAGDKYINEIWLLVYELVGQPMGAWALHGWRRLERVHTNITQVIACVGVGHVWERGDVHLGGPYSIDDVTPGNLKGRIGPPIKWNTCVLDRERSL